MKKIFYFLFSNLHLKIIAVLLALFIWFLAVLFRTHKVMITVPIEFVNLADDYIIAMKNTESLRLSLEGRGSDFLPLVLTKPKYKLNLTNARWGFNTYKLDFDNLPIKAPITVKSIMPEYVEMRIDYLDNKIVPLVVPYRRDGQKGLYITKLSYDDTVRLYGPESQLRYINEVTSESLLIASYSGGQLVRKLKVKVPDEKAFWSIPDSILVSATLEKEETKTIVVRPIQTIPMSRKRVILNPDSAQLTVRGPASAVKEMESSAIQIQIDISNLERGQYELPAEIILPKGIFLVRCEPQLFKVEIK
ncbi:MAG: CdaR family protein [candidate division WOR-3 bacterium]